MAQIKPLKAFRYNNGLAKNIGELTSPLFDVISDKQREALYKNPLNSMHISVPIGQNPAQFAAKTLAEWKKNGVIVQDEKPSIYVYYQHFNLPNNKRQYCRKGFVCNIKAYEWEEGKILRHENTIPKAVNDRVELLRETRCNVSPTHGLYSDPSFELENLMDIAMRSPIYEVEDYQGVKDVLAIIDDTETVDRFVKMLKGKTVILADGHHRYESSLEYRKAQTALNPSHDGSEAYNFHMMYLTNTESDDLRVLPTHRLIDGISDLDEQQFVEAAKDFFIIKHIENPDDVNEVILGKKWAFGVVFKNNTYKFRLKPEMIESLSWKFPYEVKKMDLTVMHFFIIEKLLGIKGVDQRASEKISFERNFTKCLTEVMMGNKQLALITNEISIAQIKEVCSSGYTLPQKSTYFFPKALCGLLFGSIEQNEF